MMEKNSEKQQSHVWLPSQMKCYDAIWLGKGGILSVELDLFAQV